MSDLKLPEAFSDRMKDLLGDEYETFLDSYEKERTYGLRINPLKMNDVYTDTVLNRLNIGKDRISWCRDGYYYNSDSCPGRSPYHEAGAYYIQEPSAMLVGELIDPKPGERICDLCAAPGGKTTHIAGRMHGEGILVSNEIVPNRAEILSRNVERMGITNCIVTCESPDALADRLPGYFHKVCVDAPCSGEGMFRKDETAITEWSPENVDKCVARQRDILEAASRLVCPGGRIVYSTCTFETSEDEDMILGFLADHQDFELETETVTGIHGSGIIVSDIENEENGVMLRVWPHKVRGEGHFAAALKRKGECLLNDARDGDFRIKNAYKDNKLPGFLHTELSLKEDSRLYERIQRGNLIEKSGHIYLIPDGVDIRLFKTTRVIRSGLCLAEYDGKRYKPDHALAMALKPDNIHNICNLTYKEAFAFLRGETVDVSGKEPDIPSGSWTLVCLDGLSMGWGKLVGSTLKNHYPKGLRRNLEA